MKNASRIEKLNYMKDILAELQMMAFDENEATLGYIMQTAVLEIESLEMQDYHSKKRNSAA